MSFVVFLYMWRNYVNEAEIKWPSFHRWHFQSIFLNENVWATSHFLNQWWLDLLNHICITWPFTDAYTHHLASMSQPPTPTIRHPHYCISHFIMVYIMIYTSSHVPEPLFCNLNQIYQNSPISFFDFLIVCNCHENVSLAWLKLTMVVGTIW